MTGNRHRGLVDRAVGWWTGAVAVVDDPVRTRPHGSALRRRAAPWAVTPPLVAFLGSARVRENPGRAFRLLQRVDPVHRSPFGFWVLSGHAEVSAALRHPRLGSDERQADGSLLRVGGLQRVLGRAEQSASDPGAFLAISHELMLFRDPPDHTRLRSLVNRAFTPRRVAALEDRIRDLSDSLLSPLRRRRRFDLMAEYAYPLPARVICDLIGLPAEDHEEIARHGRALAGGIEPLPSATELAAADRAVVGLRAYLDGHIEARRREPTDDLLSALVTAEADGDRLDHEELVATVVLLLIAGHETTANLIGNATVVLDDHPEARAALRDDPELAATAVDELLRFDAPVQMAMRIALDDVEVGGREVPAGAMLALLLGAANHDPSVVDDPSRLDLGRHPNPHVSFGGGAHHCLGAALARLEGRIALPALLGLPGLRVERPVPRRRSSFTIRGYPTLPVTHDGRG